MKRPRYLKNRFHFFEEICDPRTLEKRKIQVVDATRDLSVTLEMEDIWGSNSKANTGRAWHLSKCIQDNAVMRQPGAYAAQTTGSLLKVIYTDNIDVAYRYELPQDGRKVARINDDLKLGKKELSKIVPMAITYKPPRWNRSIEYSQSEEMKTQRAESKANRDGCSTQAYATPTESGYRDARRWYSRTVKR